jgi:hypothetical protein
MLIKSFLLSCVLIYCVCGDATQLEVVVCLLVALYIYVYALVGRISHDIIQVLHRSRVASPEPPRRESKYGLRLTPEISQTQNTDSSIYIT